MINLQTAKSLGITVPAGLLALADEVLLRRMSLLLAQFRTHALQQIATMFDAFTRGGGTVHSTVH